MGSHHVGSRRIGCVFLFLAASLCPWRPVFSQTTYNSFIIGTLAGTAGAQGSQDGLGLAAQFNLPSNVAVDGAGNVYVADRNNSTIRKIAPGGVVTTLAGAPGVEGGADGTASAAQFYFPAGIAVDSAGNVYVADTENSTIRKVTPAGVVTTLAGLEAQYGSANGTGTAARFSYPCGVAVDANGNVFVADTGNSTIRAITPGGVVTTLAGTPGAFGNSDGTGASAQFSQPTGVAVDGSGNVYVADRYNSTIRKISPSGAVTTLAGLAGNNGGADGAGAAAQFNFPSGVAVDGYGTVYVADSGDNTIRRVTAGGVVTTLAGIPGTAGSGDGTGPAAQFSNPNGIAVDGNGNVYVADAGNNTIRTGYSIPQGEATVTVGNLLQSYDGTAKSVTVTTNPAGLATVVTYNNSYTAPSAAGVYTVFAAIIDRNYTGSANGVLTIGAGTSMQPAFATRNYQAGGNFLWCITAGPSGLVTVGDNGAILSSTNGQTWTHRTSGTTNWLVSVTYGGGQYVAVGDNGTVLLSSDGATWQNVAQSATSQRLNGVIYAAGQYVAVGEGGAIINSPDGRSWTARNSGVTGWLHGLAYVSPVSYLVSSVGSSFSSQNESIPARFVATGQGGAIVSSTDGISWKQESSSVSSLLPPIGDDLEAVVAENYSSSSESTFTDTSVDFLAIGTDGTFAVDKIISEYIGTVGWMTSEVVEAGSVSVPLHFTGLAQGPSAIVGAGGNGAIVTAPSVMGPWTQLLSGTMENLASCVYIGDSLFVVGDNETILQSIANPDSRLIDLSCRSQVGTGGNIMITGFVVGGLGTSGSESVLVRGSGPALVPFGVTGTLPDPELQLFSTASGSSLLATNDAWGGSSEIAAEAATLGAFAWTSPTSHDAALLEALAPGPYTANVSGESGDTGVALAEVYDATPGNMVSGSTPRLINLSTRAQVGTGANTLIAGFVIGGTTPKTVLIRASGPALSQFGVSGVLADPELQLYSTASGNSLISTNTGWGGDPKVSTAAAWVGAFSWGTSATPDSALLVTLPPGPYTANVSGAKGDSGVALVEVYEVE